jgi:hypothetical protein
MRQTTVNNCRVVPSHRTLRQRLRLTKGCLGAVWLVTRTGPAGFGRTRWEAYDYLLMTLRWVWS